MDDLQVINQVNEGNIQAFERLVRRYQLPLFHYLGRMGIEPAIAEELVQETFIRAYRNLHGFESHRALFSTWLFTIARRLALKLLARRRQALDPAEIPDPAISLDASCEQQLIKQRISMALSQLPLKYRSPVSLAYLGELSIAEIAQIEGCAEGTVKSRIHRGKQQLKSLLSDLLGEQGHA
jgi:RNA polymerase sigma-70 factor (ECF subfamily)